MRNEKFSDELAIAAAQSIEEENYWLNKLSGRLTKNYFPYDFTGNVKQERKMEVAASRFNKKMFLRLMELSNDSDVRLFITMVTGVVLLLAKYTAHKDIVLGTSIYKQTADTEFINTVLALRNRVEGDMTFKESLMQTGKIIVEANKHLNYPIETLLHLLGMPLPGKEDFPLFDIAVLLDNIHDKKYLRNINLNIIFIFKRTGEGIEINVEYNSGLYINATIERMVSHLVNLFEYAVFNINARVAGIEILSEEEKQEILFDFNDTEAEYSCHKTMHRLFEEQVRKTPDHIAAACDGRTLSCRELNASSNQLARELRRRGVKPDRFVAVVIDRSMEMVIAVMAILKAGGAYVPIEPHLPEARIRTCLSSVSVECLLTNRSHLSKLVNIVQTLPWLENIFGLDIQDMNDLMGIASRDRWEDFLETKTWIVTEELKKHPGTNPRPAAAAGDIAYVIFTSGTTGTPKGVVAQHRPAVNLIQWVNHTYNVGEADKLLFVASLSFDLSVYDIFGILAAGGTVRVVNSDDLKLPARLLDIIFREGITYWDSAPAALQLLVPYIEELKETAPYTGKSTLRLVFLSGDWIPVTLPDILKGAFEGVEVIGLGGGTEATIWSNYYPIKKVDPNWNSIPYGRPLWNAKYYILNQFLNPCPVGLPGDLYIGGECLAIGYINDLPLTAEKFINNPFVPGETIYRTGDLARWFPDGNMEFLGRHDNQVKIRGYRIELGEIESQLLKHDHIKEAVVEARQGKTGAKGDKYLSAYYVSDIELAPRQLSDHLSKTLPAYMIPPYFVRIDNIPLTSNGKIDRKALPVPDVKTVEDYVAPRNKNEEKLVDIWSEVLGTGKGIIGINSDFFELGGHSLNAIELVSKIHKEFNIKVLLADVFRMPTIELQAVLLNTAAKKKFTPIRVVEEKENYKLSSAQKRLYVLQQIDTDNNINYNISLIFRLRGKLDKSRVEDVFKKMIKRHECFRTSFLMVNDEPRQKILEEVEFHIEDFEYSENPDPIIKNFIRAFDLSKAPLLRVGVVKNREDRYILMIDMHHILSDGVSMDIITRDFAALYANEDLPALTVQYKDYSEWQNNEKGKELLNEQEAYWLKQFEGEIPLLDLPYDYMRPKIQRFEGNDIKFIIDDNHRQLIREFEKRNQVTLYMVLLAVYYVLLMRYSSQEDIIIGTLNTGRPHVELENIIGVFINTLPIRNRPAKKKRFIDFLEEVKLSSLESLENSDYQYEELLEKIQISRNIERNPLFDVMFILQNVEMSEITVLDFELKPYELDRNISLLDLRLVAEEVGEEIHFVLEYSTNLFNTETATRMARHFVKISREVVLDPGKKLSEIDIMDGEEKNRILYEFNGFEAEFPREKSISRFVEKYTEETPDHTAVVFEKTQVTYRELNRMANRLAKELRTAGIEENRLVGIMLERSLLMAASILAVWKAGGAYIPIDIRYPSQRIFEIMEDAGARIFLSQSTNPMADLPGNLEYEILSPGEVILGSGKAGNEDNLDLEIDMNSLSYIIYTSGSSGKPKGVMIEHIGMMNHIQAKINDLNLTNRSIVAQNASHTFDISVWQFFVAFISGGRTVIFPDELILETRMFVNHLLEERVTILEVVPSYLAVLLDTLEERSPHHLFLKYLLVTGEVVKPYLVKRWFEKYPGIKLVNAYGPTEASDDITHGIMDKAPNMRQVPIGRPLQNLNIYIVDESMKLCPVGIKGEICVSGIGVGRGYLNNEEKTRAVFMEDPYRPEKRLRFYKTGDWGRWLPDGTIEFFGRKDHQVKIRGYRIELEEIENKLLSHAQIKYAVVIERGGAGSGSRGIKYLCAYLTGINKHDIPGIKQYLSNGLPHYMVPAQFVVLDRLPLSPNGKVDRKALPSPEVEFAEEYIAPGNNVEKKLIEIWAEVLGREVENLSINQDFFQLGGHSLKAITLISKIHKEMNVKISLTEIFQYSTIRELSQDIIRAKKEKYTGIEPVEKREYYHVSSAQKRLYVLHQLDLSSTGYNLPMFITVEGRLDREKLQRTFLKLIHRHESFRTFFKLVEGDPVQVITNPQEVEFEIEYFSLPGGSANLSQEDSKTYYTGFLTDNRNEFVRPFDLSRCPLFRARLVKTGEEKYMMMFDIHHIISDGISNNIFVENFILLYNDVNLSPLKLQYRDFSGWQNHEKEKENIKWQEKYWLKEFAGELPVLDMPLDYPRPVIKTVAGSSIHFIIGKEDSEALKKIAREEGVTLYMVLLAIYNIFLSIVCNQEDIIIGTTAGGRGHAALEPIIGMFVNTLPLRNFTQKEKQFTEFLGNVKTRTLEAFDNQDYQFEDLVGKVAAKRDQSRNPLFDVLFAYLDFNSGSREIPIEEKSGLKYLWNQFERKASKFDMTLEVSVGFNLSCVFEYSTKLFEKEKIERFIKYFNEIISAVIINKNILVKDIKISHDLLHVNSDIHEHELADFGF